MKKEINDKYIIERFGKNLPQKNINSLKSAMLKYGDNYQWESNNPAQVAMYQIFEDVLMVDFSKFHEGLEKIIGRLVFSHELGLNVEGIRKEVCLGIKRLKKGIGTSEEYKETAVRKSIQMFEDYCKRNKKQLLKFDLSELQKDNKNNLDNSDYDGWLNPED